MTIRQRAETDFGADSRTTDHSADRSDQLLSRRAGDGQGAPIRWVEFIAVVAIIGLGLTLAATPAIWIPTSTLIGAIAAVCVLTVPLPAEAEGVHKSATARRTTEATIVGIGASLIPMALTDASMSIVGLIVTAGVMWAALSLILTVRPLAIYPTQGWAPEPRWRRSSRDRVTLGLEHTVKRAIDIVGSLVILAITSPILVLTTLAIRRDGGPALFRQERIAGPGASTFPMLKFRSMVVDAEARKAELAEANERSGPIFKLSDDPRITPVGHIIRDLSIDELPQLLNVLKGEMSLVGPRPALLDEAAEFDPGFLAKRSEVKPGLTGLWQAEARNEPDFGRYESLDLRYVDEWSLGLDIRILLATVVEVLVAVASKPLRAMGFDVAAGDTVIDLREPATVIDLREDRAA